MKKFFCAVIFLCQLFFSFLGSSSQAYAMSSLGCLGVGAAEYFIPGLGYGITHQWDKALILGGMRWAAYSQWAGALKSPYYQKNPNDIYHTTSAKNSESGKDETTIRLTKETWLVDYYASIDGDLLFTSWGDLYQNGCEANTETYQLMLSPFRLDHFYNKWEFWLPVAVVLVNYQTFAQNSKVTYYLERGLTEKDLKNNSFSQYYMVGVGEEMLFRGTIQNYFFSLFKDTWEISPEASRHLSIFTASAVFAAAHSGTGFTASPAGAFLFGVYEGYVYHPSLEEFDLMTSIAIHSWWDILVTYAILNHADYKNSNLEVPLFKIGFQF